MSESEVPQTPSWMVRSIQLKQSFVPGKPADTQDLFTGRQLQINRLTEVVSQPGRHALLFGERGVGKTSLALYLQSLYEERHQIGLEVPRTKTPMVSCETEMTFEAVWGQIFGEIEGSQDEVPLTDFTPNSIRKRLQRLFPDSIEGPVIFIVDEMDRFNNFAQDRQLMADTIKNLSDHSVNVTLILVGVAETADALIESHESVRRSLVEIKMPRMQPDEQVQIIDKGLARLFMTMEDQVKRSIIGIARGFPYYVHLLCLYACKAAIDEQNPTVNENHFGKAISQAYQDVEGAISRVYSQAVASSRSKELRPMILVACSLTNLDSAGYFRSVDATQKWSQLGRKSTNILKYLKEFCGEDRGKILERDEVSKANRFRFRDRLMPTYALLYAFKEGYINIDFSRPDEVSE